MTTSRGFVQRIEVGRGGLVRIDAVLVDGSQAQFVISDLDADPERFNERLSKLAVLRDAMNRAEPVEIEHDKGESGEEIQRAVRITRDAIGPVLEVDQVAGLVVGVSVHSENAVATGGERHDTAEVRILSVDGGTEIVWLDLQMPERLVATGLLDMLSEALAAGAFARLLVTSSAEDGRPWIVQAAVVDGTTAFGRESGLAVVSGFVESLGIVPIAGTGALGGLVANARFTTAPEFTGPGGTVDPASFTPHEVTLLVPKSSTTYDLVEAGLRDNVRMRVAVAPLKSDRKDDEGNADNDSSRVELRSVAAPSYSSSEYAVPTAGTDGQVSVPVVLTVAAELLAPLASASRPVWITIDRDMLDQGPADDCMPGVPTSDLSPMSMRDLKLPYTARWRGLGCFNRGVYRIEFCMPGDLHVSLDDTELCLYDSDPEGCRFAYACLEGDHWLTVEIGGWTCDNEFRMDAYRIR